METKEEVKDLKITGSWSDDAKLCFMCQSPKDTHEEHGIVCCDRCADLLKGNVVLYCISCSNVQIFEIVPVMLERIQFYRDNGYEIADAFGVVFIYYDSCPKCITQKTGNA